MGGETFSRRAQCSTSHFCWLVLVVYEMSFFNFIIQTWSQVVEFLLHISLVSPYIA